MRLLNSVFLSYLLDFPIGVSILLILVLVCFAAITVINITLSIVWVVNELKELFQLI